MKFESLDIDGACLVLPERLGDERGFFARTFCSRTFAENGLDGSLRQCSISFNPVKHTLRGLHYQRFPHEENKLVRCTRGAAHHVVADLREASATYLEWTAVELNAENRHLLYVPAGVAHGFITLAESTEIAYQMSADYAPESAAGIRWDDPALSIAWPAKPALISDRDANYADYRGGA